VPQVVGSEYGNHGQFAWTNLDRPTLTGTASPGATITLSRLSIPGHSTVVTTTGLDGIWTVTLPSDWHQDSGDFSQTGMVSYEIRASDNGNIYTKSEQVTFNLIYDDNIYPVYLKASIANSAHNLTHLYFGSYEAGFVQLFDGDYALTGWIDVNYGSNFKFEPQFRLGEGTHHLGAVFRDYAGNRRTTTVDALVDTQAPDFSRTSDTVDFQAGVWTYSGHAEPGATIIIGRHFGVPGRPVGRFDGVYGFEDGTQLALAGRTVADANGDWTIRMDGDHARLADEFVAIDAAKNKTELSFGHGGGIPYVQAHLDARWRDFDGNGTSDLFWHQADTGFVNMWLTSANGSVNKEAPDRIGDPVEWYMAGTGDFNGDGRADVIWRYNSHNITTGLFELQMDGEVVSGGGSITDPGKDWALVAVGDFNGDGKADLIWRSTDWKLVGWWMDGTSVTSIKTLAGPGSQSQPSLDLPIFVKGVGDFNGDGISDILWQRSDGEYYAGMTNTDTSIAYRSIGNIPSMWTMAGIGDFNGDGKSDIIWTAQVDQDTVILKSDLTEMSNDPAELKALVAEALGSVVDELLDLPVIELVALLPDRITVHSTGYLTSIWFMNGSNVILGSLISDVTNLRETGYNIAATGDYNGDGFTDLAWQNPSTWDTKVTLMCDNLVSSQIDLGAVPPNWFIYS
jgi:hypothetical protein